MKRSASMTSNTLVSGGFWVWLASSVTTSVTRWRPTRGEAMMATSSSPKSPMKLSVQFRRTSPTAPAEPSNVIMSPEENGPLSSSAPSWCTDLMVAVGGAGLRAMLTGTASEHSR